MKTICIYHKIDLDGWMSAAIVKKWFIKGNKYWTITNLNFKQKFNSSTNRGLIGEKNPVLSMLGWDYGDKIPDLSKYDKVIMVDVAFPKEEMINLIKRLAAQLIWIDHHASAIIDSKGVYDGSFGIRDTKFAACELTWKYFFQGIRGDPDKESSQNKMPEIVRLLGRYDCFGHKGTDEEQKVLEFQYGARQCITNYNEAHVFLDERFEEEIIGEILDKGKVIYKYLCTEAKQTYAKAFPVSIGYKPGERAEADPAIHGRYNFLCVNQERFNPINFGINYHDEGYDGFACFWYKDGKWTWSLYNDNGEADCSVIAKQYEGGGHKGAAGFVCDTKILLTIINQ